MKTLPSPSTLSSSSSSPSPSFTLSTLLEPCSSSSSSSSPFPPYSSSPPPSSTCSLPSSTSEKDQGGGGGLDENYYYSENPSAKPLLSSHQRGGSIEGILPTPLTGPSPLSLFSTLSKQRAAYIATTQKKKDLPPHMK
ncbi:hypothetical protein CSUI_007404 [Cystoisospora suis]|uniref:Uncharacterized protein n=1 Tax=Cystoisospora suis TaxID=483139 RepID=A0A2C6KQK3_9APIC|nr:hypothetical protein CSUI_007404 [Cystoisospora suis]